MLTHTDMRTHTHIHTVNMFVLANLETPPVVKIEKRNIINNE